MENVLNKIDKTATEEVWIKYYVQSLKDVKWDRKGQKKGVSTSPRSLETQQEIKKLIKEAHTLVSRRKK